MGELPPGAAALVQPDRVWSRAEVLGRPSPVPAVAGTYAWYFKQLPTAIDTTSCISWAGLTLLYVGISPRAPPASGVGASRQNLRRRLRQHYALNAYGSTLRLTLGCLLADQLGLVLRRVGSGTRLTFADGEARLSQWMADNAFVCWVAHERPWELEDALVKTLDLPLNLHGNDRHPFRAYLRGARAAARDYARALPVWPS
jgi:GIY-YIG catalytic domain-containing protein